MGLEVQAPQPSRQSGTAAERYSTPKQVTFVQLTPLPQACLRFSDLPESEQPQPIPVPPQLRRPARKCRFQLVTLGSESDSDSSVYPLALTEYSIEDTIIVAGHRGTIIFDSLTSPRPTVKTPPRSDRIPPSSETHTLTCLFTNYSIPPTPTPLPHVAEPISRRLGPRKR